MFLFGLIDELSSSPFLLLSPNLLTAVNPKVIGSIAFPSISLSSSELKSVADKVKNRYPPQEKDGKA